MLTRPLSQACLTLTGWRIEGEMPDLPRFLVIGAPHTSWFDWVLNLCLMGRFDLPLRWTAKSSLFRGPLGRLLLRLGGVPIERGARSGFVRTCIALFETEERCVIGILPEGTRKRTDGWKSGFYHIALAAGVPVVPVSVDGPTRLMRVGEPRRMSGDPEADMALLRDFYQGARGIVPANAGPVRLSPLPTSAGSAEPAGGSPSR